MDKIKKFLSKLGPGVITGAADDDPAGIATYALSGARYGFSLLWTAWITFPLMTAVQETCGRIGLVTRKGLAGVIAMHYPRPVLLIISSLLLIANIFNIGADISGMAAAFHLLLPVNEIIVSFLATVLIVFLTIRLPYKKIATGFKWLTLALFAYVATFFLSSANISEVIYNAFIFDPRLAFQPSYLVMIVALFGTTISPYLFFWQTSEEAEEEKLKHVIVTKNELKSEEEDTFSGMFFSQLIAFFIIATTGATLFKAGVTNIDTAAQAALALRPLAGEFAYLLFAVGIIGTGMLAIPVLAGSAAYAVAETFGFKEGLNKPFQKAKAFYGVVIAAMVLGFLLNFLGISPIKYLFYSAVLNGLISPIMILMLLLIANNKKIMGKYTNPFISNLLSLVALIIMTAAGVAIFIVK